MKALRPQASKSNAMSYIDGFVLAVLTANKQAFMEHARTGDSVFMEFGATRVANVGAMTYSAAS